MRYRRSPELRVELQSKGLKVSEIAPGMVDTDIRNDSDHPAVIAAVNAKVRAIHRKKWRKPSYMRFCLAKTVPMISLNCAARRAAG